ncbi:MAG: CHAT domain-containing protein [Phycisphaerae bacterium]|nr:CHAT domain-containing protein [Gemmatimonadaceae bacterium]
MPTQPEPQPVAAANAGAAGTPRAYIDLAVELRDLNETADTFVVCVLPSAVGDSTPFPVTLNMAELQADLGRLEAKKLTMAKLMALGERLANRLLPVGEVRNLFNVAVEKAGRAGGVRLRLIIRDAALAQLPWEYVYVQKSGGEKHRSGFLTLNPQISIVRHEVMPEEPWPLVTADPSRLRIVIATAAVTHADIVGLGEYDFGELDVALERNAIVAAVRDLKVDGVTVDAQKVLNEATPADVTEALVAGADVFHFAGHGYYSTAERDTAKVAAKFGGMILLHEAHGSPEGTVLLADDLAMTLQRAGVRLAVLGACESARRDNASPWSAVAPALVRRGLPAAVAMQYEVIDEQAIAFSRMMYTSIAAGLSLDEAVSVGRQAMLASSEGNNVEWGVPVLYMRTTNGALFAAIAEKASTVATQLRVAIEQVVDTIAKGGEVVGIRAEQLGDGTYKVVQSAKVVEGSMVGVVIGKL